MHLIIFTHSSISNAIHNVEHEKVATCFAGIIGNKGGIGISMNIGEKKYLFINCHLCSG